ncbi:retrovirus-related Pol polyprotein from transposon 17.6 [Trichonephila clavipes]|nr:retrovirus-related Pol polyprotein from transposon 17.6 [Trichonephila clavipes]
MRKAVWAVYFHIRSSDEEPLHSFCPVGPNSWCKYQNQVVEGSVQTFRHILPLTELTKNRVPNIIPWNEAAEQAFTKLKAQLVKAASLYTPNLSKPYQLYTDASATAIGACLSQNDENGKENPIAFFSKKLTETQTRWATIEREAYAVIEALKRFDS